MTTQTTPQVTLSDRAAMEIRKLVKERTLPETAGLRFGLKGGGCSGFEYRCEMAAKPDKFDMIYEFDDARVFVDRKSIIFLENTHIDYKRALMGSGFQFNNPNATGECGCGTSFAV
ncbi:MAG: iron-sulfur cluster assembly accessory protein [Planctomycetota bacterium]|nr:iron-sulfur cluster assembly accessory protein [Planctomycetota bacterium]